MKKDCKRLLGLALILCLLISIVPAVVAAEETEPAVTNIYTPDYSTAVNGQLMEGWGVYTNTGLWGEKDDETEPLTLLPEIISGQADGAGLALVYSAEENSLHANFKKSSSKRPYVGLYRMLDDSYNAISVSYTHIAGDASKMNRILMPGYFNESVAAGKDRFSGFPLEAIVENDVLTVKWDGTAIYSEDIDWRHNGEKVQIVAYSNAVDGGYAVGFALYISGQYKCGATKLMTSFAGFNAIRFGFYNGKNTDVTMKDISVDAMDLDSLGLYDLDNPPAENVVDGVGYVPDVQYADPLHIVESDATSGYAFVSWKVDETLLYAPDFVGETDGTLPTGWNMSLGYEDFDFDLYTLAVHETKDAYDAATYGTFLDYSENRLDWYYKQNSVRTVESNKNKTFHPGIYRTFDETYDAMSVSYDLYAVSAGKAGFVMMPTYYNAETGKLITLPLSVRVYGNKLYVSLNGASEVGESIIVGGVTVKTSETVPLQLKTVAFVTESEIGYALYVNGEYKYGITIENTLGITGFNAVQYRLQYGANCTFAMENIRVRSMDADSFGVYNLDAPAGNYGYVIDKQYVDPLHTAISDATTGYVFTTWKEDSSFLKRFDFSADTDGTLPAGWELSYGPNTWNYSAMNLPLYATAEAWAAAKEASGANYEPGMILQYKDNSMYVYYKERSVSDAYSVGMYYQMDDTYETMTVSYDHYAPSSSKTGQPFTPVYYDAATGSFTTIPLTIKLYGSQLTVTWNGENLTADADAGTTYVSLKTSETTAINFKIKAFATEETVGFEMYIDGELAYSGTAANDNGITGFNAIRYNYLTKYNGILTMDNILVYTDVARIGTDFYRTAEAAAEAAVAGDTLELLVDSNDVINVAADMTIDMNGHNLSGAVIADGVTLTGYDSANNDYSTYGTIASVSGNVASAATVDGRSYIAIADGNGGVSFHRYYLKTTATVLHVEKAAPSLYYKYALAGDEAVLGAIDSCGVAYWKGETEESVMAQTSLPEGAYSAGTAAEAAAGALYTGEGTLVSFTSEDVESVISGRAYIKVGDTVIFSDNCLSDTAGGSIETADSLWETLLVKQRNALRKLYEAFADVIGLLDIDNYYADTAAVLASFQEDLAQEETYAQVQTAGWVNSENAATNGDFSNGIAGWNKYQTSVAEAVTEDGNTVLSLSRVTNEDGTTTVNNPFVSQSAELVPGSRCEISFRYKVVARTEGESVAPCVYLCSYDANGREMEVSGVWPYSKVADGEWGTVSGYVYLPENAVSFSIRVRARTTYDCQVYFDDVVVRSEHIALDTQNVFFYTDSIGENAELTAAVYGGDCSTVTFQVYRETEQVWASDAIAVADGKASVSFALSNLTQIGQPYAVVATAKNSDGTVTYVQTQNIYMYHRPTHYTADGTFLRDGEAFYPVFGYGVSTTDIKSADIALENAISVARIGTFTSADAAVAALDALEAKGMMGMICMHPGMHTSGSVYNMEQTLTIMGDPRVHNHPALFGYCVQDEAFVNYTDGDPLYDLENAYRLIRKLDNKHIIMATENYSAHYTRTSKYLDAMIADIYCDAAEQKVYDKISLASQMTEKPVYALTRACVLTNYSELPTINDMRNNNYQALLGGATGLGYYKFDKANGSGGDIWADANEDGTGGNPELWAAMKQFYMNENELLMKHFYSVDYETIQQNLVKEDSYWHYSFEADGSTYVIILGMMEDAASSVAAQISGGWTDCTVRVVAGTGSVPAIADGVLSVTVNGVEAILCQITPNA